MLRWLAVGLGGLMGAMLRYGLSGWVYARWGVGFPYGTLVVNVLGCFGLGFLMPLLEEKLLVGPAWRAFWTIGLLGAFTTFSTFSYETLMLLRDGSDGLAALNVAVSVALGLLAAYTGLVQGRLI